MAPGIGPEVSLLTEAWRALGGDVAALGRVKLTGAPQLASTFPVNALATASIGVAALASGSASLHLRPAMAKEAIMH